MSMSIFSQSARAFDQAQDALDVDLLCGHTARVLVPTLGTDSATREAVALIADVERQDRRGEWPCTACVPLAVAA